MKSINVCVVLLQYNMQDCGLQLVLSLFNYDLTYIFLKDHGDNFSYLFILKHKSIRSFDLIECVNLQVT